MNTFYVDGMKIRDNYGRERIFRGINVCIKTPDISPHKLEKILLSEQNISHLKSTGATIIRLGVTWSLIEQIKGVYNDDIIDVIEKYCRICSEMGIYILLDMHQDVYSPYFHGDGVPKWAVDKSLTSKRPVLVWAEGYFYMDDVQKAFYDFWTDKNGVQTDFINMWQYFSKRLSHIENVIAYDYFNEPYIHKNGRKIFLSLLHNAVSEIYKKDMDFSKYFKNGKDKKGFLKCLWQIAKLVKTPNGVKFLLSKLDDKDLFKRLTDNAKQYTDPFNRDYYQPFMDRISSAVNKNNKLDLFEHNYFSNLGIPFDIEKKPSYVYSPHAYDFFIDTPLYEKYSSNNRIDAILESIRENQLKMTAPVIFGEWGGSPTSAKDFSHLEHIAEIFEKYHWSHIYWGKTSDALNDFFMTPYPVAVCGDIISFHTDRKNHSFSLKWECKDLPSEDIKTEVFVPGKSICKYDSQQGINEITISY